ncbi:DJ-1/PfpI family protein [Paucisalibacillus sp. EB02]|uniref:DJ-1/PfpI family protein n=1 Tax=Paucisalibacillus sp. EB02 TaxID=1347087 RepID=UPI0005A80CC9|nr:DJ-1/PfpI family protein [Paucisalibacillus sp. EB02]
MINVLFLAYPMYADFEIGHTLYFLRKLGKAKVTTATVDGEPVESLGGIVTQAQLAISKVDSQDYDLLLISGGDGVAQVLDNVQLQEFLKEYNNLKKPIAAICASSTLLGKAGLLVSSKFTCAPNTFEMFSNVFSDAEYTGNRLEVVDNIITAKGTAFPEFTIAVIDQLRLWKNNEQREGALNFCKGEV